MCCFFFFNYLGVSVPRPLPADAFLGLILPPPDIPAELGLGPDSENCGAGGIWLMEPRLGGRFMLLGSGVLGIFGREPKAAWYSGLTDFGFWLCADVLPDFWLDGLDSLISFSCVPGRLPLHVGGLIVGSFIPVAGRLWAWLGGRLDISAAAFRWLGVTGRCRGPCINITESVCLFFGLLLVRYSTNNF